jgi:hypothetical protein
MMQIKKTIPQVSLFVLSLVGVAAAQPEWNLLIPADSPSARYDHSMVYDADHQRVVLFGGETNGTFLGDTWLWDGDTWTQVATAGPSPSARARSAMAFDSGRHRVVLFGGWDGQHFGDTWEWTGEAWERVHPRIAPGVSSRASTGSILRSWPASSP